MKTEGLCVHFYANVEQAADGAIVPGSVRVTGPGAEGRIVVVDYQRGCVTLGEESEAVWSDALRARDRALGRTGSRRSVATMTGGRGPRTTSGRVAPAQRPHPPVGTPAPASHAGNSTRPAASVRGSQKSERTGERDRTEVNGRAVRHVRK